MKKYINQYNRECWQGITNDTPFNSDMFHVVFPYLQEDKQWALHTNIGSITVVDRLTGFNWRDIETGFRANNGEFWLASGNFDIRDHAPKTFGEAIELIKKNANTCVGIGK